MFKIICVFTIRYYYYHYIYIYKYIYKYMLVLTREFQCTRHGLRAESLFWRLIEETSVRPGDLAALRTGTVQYGDSNAFLMVCTHGYLSKILDPEFLQSVAYLILDESQQRTLTLSFIKAILERFRRTTRLVLMGAGLDVAAI